MQFKQAFDLMKQGYNVKLPSWEGYWFWDKERKTIMIKCRAVDSETGKNLLDIRETQRVEYTLENIMSDEWVIATNENCTVLGGTPTFSFSEAMKYLKRGLKLKRESWNDDVLYVQLTKKIDLKETQDYNHGFKDINLNSFTEVMIDSINANWTPKYDDMMANDWCFS